MYVAESNNYNSTLTMSDQFKKGVVMLRNQIEVDWYKYLHIY